MVGARRGRGTKAEAGGARRVTARMRKTLHDRLPANRVSLIGVDAGPAHGPPIQVPAALGSARRDNANPWRHLDCRRPLAPDSRRPAEMGSVAAPPWWRHRWQLSGNIKGDGGPCHHRTRSRAGATDAAGTALDRRFWDGFSIRPMGRRGANGTEDRAADQLVSGPDKLLRD